MNHNLKIKNLIVDINHRNILNNISLEVKTGQIIGIVGPNGAGKSTLLKSIMHHFSCEIKNGEIIFDDQNIENKQTYEIARLGFFYADQNPIELDGVPMLEYLKEILKINNRKSSFYENFKKINDLFESLSLDKELLKHSVNVGFSGGQKKKSEIIQSQLLDSNVLLLDEVDSGLDIDALKIIAKYISDTKDKHITLVVSHHLDFFNSLKPDKIILIENHAIAKIGGQEIIEDIKKNGYKQYENNEQKRPIDPHIF